MSVRQLVAAAIAVALAACGREPDRRPPPAAETLPPSQMPCGRAQTCDARTHYCEQIKTDVPALPSTYTCKPLPSTCQPDPDQPPGCGCFAKGTRCRNFCRQVDTTGVTGFELICVGGA